jgi:uncharacterized membrane protein
MLHSLLIGMAGGMRSMTPLAAVALAAQRGDLPEETDVGNFLAQPLVVGGAMALAAGELAGDKWHKAPDRIVPAGLAARMVTGALTGAALAPRSQQAAGAALGVLGAIVSSYITFNIRIRAMERYGQFSTGVVEDVLAMAATTAVIQDAAKRNVERQWTSDDFPE